MQIKWTLPALRNTIAEIIHLIKLSETISMILLFLKNLKMAGNKTVTYSAQIWAENCFEYKEGIFHIVAGISAFGASNIENAV